MNQLIEIKPDLNYLKPQVELNIVYQTFPDGTQLHLNFLYPVNYHKNMKYPLILQTKGSGWMKQNLGHGLLVWEPIVEKGYCVAEIEYRTLEQVSFPGQVIDSNSALEFLLKNQSQFNFDPDKIILAGDSSGGHTALLQLLTKDDQKYGLTSKIDFCGLIDYYAPTDLSLIEDDDYLNSQMNAKMVREQFLKLKDKETENELVKAHRVIPYLDKIDNVPPILILHGSKDNIVPLTQSQALYEALVKKGSEVEMIVIPGVGHADPSFWAPEVNNSVISFLDHLFTE